MSNPNKESKTMVIKTANLSQVQRNLIQLTTPTEFIKTRPGKGGKKFTYIEGGYVIARLNQIFSPVGWEFEVISERVEQHEVVIRGRLTVKGFDGLTISKEQYGTHDRLAGIPLGDTLKAATTDALKKCASMIGVGLDIYWQNDRLETADKETEKAKPEVNSFTAKPEELLKKSLAKIDKEGDPAMLVQYKIRINESELYSQAQKLLLVKTIDNKLKTYV
jgi:hypothetical protein